jgi:hypothetical protein
MKRSIERELADMIGRGTSATTGTEERRDARDPRLGEIARTRDGVLDAVMLRLDVPLKPAA